MTGLTTIFTIYFVSETGISQVKISQVVSQLYDHKVRSHSLVRHNCHNFRISPKVMIILIISSLVRHVPDSDRVDTDVGLPLTHLVLLW